MDVADTDTPEWIEVPTRLSAGSVAVSSRALHADEVISVPSEDAPVGLLHALDQELHRRHADGRSSATGGVPVDVSRRLGSWMVLASTDLVAADATAVPFPPARPGGFP